ncbi:uncharacterized protein LOC133312318 [Gastrolobium bilobum]|uniref:uncharacterized protein LOC133312318 n=1 Tax=Gastrolobium bilobum TaxID=150636 RepID=UPI002AB2C108|nr:uncharacterized protein LOC133312318 [Gastrolobium bilobum]
MRAPAMLRSFTLRQFQPRVLPVAVAPLPEKTRFDRELTAELDNLRSQGTDGGEIGLAQLLDAAITTQKIALDSFVNISYIDDADRGAVDKYLEENVEILDACNYFMDKMENINEYVDSLRVVVHLVDSGSAKPNAVAATRALELLESCQSIEKRCKSMGNRVGSCFKKLLKQKLCHETELNEIMCGSKAMALLCCRFLEIGLSFDSKSGFFPTMKQSQPTSSSWLKLVLELAKQAEGSAEKKLQKRRYCLLMNELQQTVTAARDLKEQIKGKREMEMKYAVERLKISCRELEDVVEIIEGRVKDLYKILIDVRMTFLGIISQTYNF